MAQGIDGFTAGVLIGAVKTKPDLDQVCELVKSLSNSSDRPSDEDIQKIFAEAQRRFKPRDLVKIDHTDYVGTIAGYNTSTGGFYPGWRFPVYVKIDGSCFEDKESRTFEYVLDQVLPLSVGPVYQPFSLGEQA
jgi:hypothetical protein